jgi:competence protein ComEC
LVLVAATYGRITHAYGAIFLTATVMMVFNPLLLRYDVGFQLSFLATLGIVSTYPLLEGRLVNKKIAFGIIDVLLLTASAQLFVMPIIAYHFHTISLVSLLANVLVLPIIPLTMLFVFLMVVVNFVFHPAALFFGWIAYFLLQYEISVITILARVSWGSVTIEDVSMWWFVVYYIIMGFVVYLLNKYLYEV